MANDDIESRIRDYIATEFGHRLNGLELQRDLNLLSEGVVDSMGVMHLVSFVEENFGCTVEDDDVTPGNFRSIVAIAALVETKGKGANS